MDTGRPSRTALGVALRRASHQLYDPLPRVLADPVVVPLLSTWYTAALQRTQQTLDEPASVGLRAFLLARSRYAEEQLARAVAGGCRQYCLLGAGLDTFAHRNPHAGVRVFEVDHPATQLWKREMLAVGGFSHPPELRYVPLDFERQDLATELLAAGFDPAQPAVFAWLGVVMYLTREAFRATVAYLATLAHGTGLVFDYGLPREALDTGEQTLRDALMARVAAAGEPFQLAFLPEEVRSELSCFPEIEDLDADALNARYFAGRSDGLKLRGKASHVVTAWL